MLAMGYPFLSALPNRIDATMPCGKNPVIEQLVTLPSMQRRVGGVERNKICGMSNRQPRRDSHGLCAACQRGLEKAPCDRAVLFTS